ncbi:hypothetical protein D9B85_05840 [Corynebacterium diphtheriae]|uniref:hypothetical protein n=1 Tax=Corynebacterium diphtheriae TaxID=1717 RepID=UPI000893D11F|nr:hypothetical protein [Corynebacterium diphtheriae]MBG9277527.1 hypothetical protein [Corynebacterium diphtheriae bv. mitis]MBG9282010.1 hypothetical protein [Corynebacterium diphtheriae bv. mitis]MBG9296492.1 hypothetical protein [Corynebacterium diphtheriae bv. gravis]MBG9339339.1 hypothetical protein [Corynebacterium diphtheriae bv. mitis]OFI51516.1 hypothetical protein BKD82_10190 [Corynebacterium diphtheriae]
MLTQSDILTLTRDDNTETGYQFRGDTEELLNLLETEGWTIHQTTNTTFTAESPIEGEWIGFDSGMIQPYDAGEEPAWEMFTQAVA